MLLATSPLAAAEAAAPASAGRTAGRHAPRSGGRPWAGRLALAGLLALGSGCSVCQQAWRTVVQEPKQYSYKKDREASIAEYRQLAERVWRSERARCADGSASVQYVRGFIDGFSEYVYAGGLEPPPVPPPMFWNLPWRTPPGHEAAADWFAGYRHGARTAHFGGYRDLGIVHASFAYAPGYLAEPMAVATPTEGEPLPPALETEPLPSAPPTGSDPPAVDQSPQEPSLPDPPVDDPDVALFKSAMLRRATSARSAPDEAAENPEVLQMPDLRQESH